MEFDDVERQGDLLEAFVLIRRRNSAPFQDLAKQRIGIRESRAIKSCLLGQRPETIKHSDYQG